VTNRSTASAVTIAALVGAALWFVTSLVTGKREPWDAAVYWAVAYPVAIGASAILGYAYRDRPWRWPLVLFEAQFIAMCLRNGELGNLWPLGMALFAVIAVPGVVAARAAARFKTASGEGTA
jgi:hypothetical protein